ncbi:MAG: site-specific integrase, partial [Planctomycetota bacterium]|nr:site-specific integrase [Planctomycetota bacterium]
MAERIEYFLTYLESVRNYSHETIRSYRNDLKQFRDFLQERFSIADPSQAEQISNLIVRSYLVFLKERQYQKTTITRKVATLKSFFKFLTRKRIANNNPMLLIRSQRVNKKLPDFMTESEVENIIKQPLIHPPKYRPREGRLISLRNLAILELLYSSGLRVSELANLKIRDIDFNSSVAHILGKGRKERLVPIGSFAMKSIEEYLKTREDFARENLGARGRPAEAGKTRLRRENPAISMGSNNTSPFPRPAGRGSPPQPRSRS